MAETIKEQARMGKSKHELIVLLAKWMRCYKAFEGVIYKIKKTKAAL